MYRKLKELLEKHPESKVLMILDNKTIMPKLTFGAYVGKATYMGLIEKGLPDFKPILLLETMIYGDEQNQPTYPDTPIPAKDILDEIGYDDEFIVRMKIVNRTFYPQIEMSATAQTVDLNSQNEIELWAEIKSERLTPPEFYTDWEDL